MVRKNTRQAPGCRLVLIGNGKLAIDCLALLRDSNAEIALVVYDPREAAIGSDIADFCRRHSLSALPVEHGINRPDRLRHIVSAQPDLIFNVNSFFIFRQPILEAASRGVVNFHNAPLPLFRGVHSPSWAIIEDVRQYGVTWHWVDESIDTGDIIARRPVEIAPDETALSLTIKCMLAGKSLFGEILPALLAGMAARTPQTGPVSYFSLRDTPNGGYIDFSMPCRTIDCLVRGLNFRPARNTFTYAKLRIKQRDVVVNRVSSRPEAPRAAPGTVLTASDRSLHVTAADGIVAIEEVMWPDEQPVSIAALGIQPGDVLETAAPER